MPSRAYDEYLANLRDVHRLVLLHASLNGTGRGRRGLGHLTRGGILLLCAAWERYAESLLEEAAGYFARHITTRLTLPAHTAQKILNYANSNNNTWTAAQANGHTWSPVYLDYVKRQTDALNTPKYDHLKRLFHDCVGVPDIATLWSRPSSEVTAFVSLRGEVAHRGASSTYVAIAKLKDLQETVSTFVIETDNEIASHLKQTAGTRRLPWNKAR